MTTFGAAGMPVEDSLATDWRDFIRASGVAMKTHRNRWFRRHRRTLTPWHLETLDALSSDRFVNTLSESWQQARYDDRMHPPLDLLRKELNAITDMLLSVVDAPGISEPARARRRKRPSWWTRFTSFGGLKEGVKASGTLMGSVKDLLDEAAPDWLKALLIIGQEMMDLVGTCVE